MIWPNQLLVCAAKCAWDPDGTSSCEKFLIHHKAVFPPSRWGKNEWGKRHNECEGGVRHSLPSLIPEGPAYNAFKQSETTVTISRKLKGFISQRLPDFSRNSSVLGELVSPVMKIMLWASFGLISFTFS